MRKRKLVENQDVKKKDSKDTSCGEHSPYWDDYNAHARNEEHVLANPDSLQAPQPAAPSTPQLIMGEAVQHLQGRQREVYLLLMRENKTYAEVAEILQISRGVVQEYEKRAVKFIESYCKQAIAKGRV